MYGIFKTYRKFAVSFFPKSASSDVRFVRVCVFALRPIHTSFAWRCACIVHSHYLIVSNYDNFSCNYMNSGRAPPRWAVPIVPLLFYYYFFPVIIGSAYIVCAFVVRFDLSKVFKLFFLRNFFIEICIILGFYGENCWFGNIEYINSNWSQETCEEVVSFSFFL